jgi:hypothetical protein
VPWSYTFHTFEKEKRRNNRVKNKNFVENELQSSGDRI